MSTKLKHYPTSTSTYAISVDQMRRSVQLLFWLRVKTLAVWVLVFAALFVIVAGVVAGQAVR